MPEYKYISERFERRTYLKGKFKGKFIGQLDNVKSDKNHDRFFDLEILEGEIFTTQNNVTLWTDGGEHTEFARVSKFLTRLPGEINVTLQYLDGSLKHFKVKLQELKLINCRLSNQLHTGDELFGTIAGDVCGYLLHYDTVLLEIEEEPKLEPKEKPITLERDRPDQPRPEKDHVPRINWTTRLRETFTRNPYRSGQKTGCFPVFNFLFGTLLFVGVLLILQHWLFLLLIVAGFLLIPRIYNWLGRRFNFNISRWAAALLYFGYFSVVLLCLIKFYQGDKKQELLSKNAQTNAEKLNAEQQKNNKQNKDSFDYYFDAAKALRRRHKHEPALEKLDHAFVFASPEEKKQITNERIAILNSQAEILVKKEQYEEAIPIYTNLILLERPNPAVYLYKRAETFLAVNKIPEAVKDLKLAVSLGDKPAEILHNKINPLKNVIVGYVIRCRDGSTSDSKSRQGTCSHHGGVKDWNEPVYEEHRKYE